MEECVLCVWKSVYFVPYHWTYTATGTANVPYTLRPLTVVQSVLHPRADLLRLELEQYTLAINRIISKFS
jgi:hypothetical protein